MSYESSYDSGSSPFRPNKDRGLWSRPSDFLFACMGNAFRMDIVYGIAVVPIIASTGCFSILGCLVSILLYGIPIIYIQSFMGQFSSSGMISVFRIAPLFKGMGYVGLSLNIFSLTFYSLFAAVPLLFFLHSLQSTLPWSCEGMKEWMTFNESEYALHHCTFNKTETNEIEEAGNLTVLEVPSAEYFVRLVEGTFSFYLFGCVLAVWAGVAFVLFCNTTERIGQIFRYCAITLGILLTIVFVRMIYLPGAMEGLANEFSTEHRHWHLSFLLWPLLIFASFGPGWGTVLSMASYNKFKVNISQYSWMICVSHNVVLVMVALVCMFTQYHLTNNDNDVVAPMFELQWAAFLTIPSALAGMTYPHLWSWIFFAVLIIGSFNLMLLQMFSVLTALFDEFEQLRRFRKEVIFGTSAFLALTSALFCTEDGIFFIEVLADLSAAGQGLLNLLLVIVVLWVYGRERFQRDVEFMTSQVLATWKVFIVQRVTPSFVTLTMFITFFLSIFTHNESQHLVPIAEAFAVLPWLTIPVYCIFRLMQTTGSIRARFKRCTKPTDWYPVDSEYRLRYEETIGNAEMSHPLTTNVL